MTINELRKYLIDYYGTAKTNASPLATMDLIDVERMTDDELIRFAERKGFISKQQDDDYER